MAIKSIDIENFTVFEKVQIDFSPGINVFIGENGTGKTHLLKLLYAANTMFSSSSKHNINELFGNQFNSGDLRFNINGDESYPWKLAASQEMTQPESYIHLAINEKNPSVFIPAKEVLSMANITKVAEDYKKNLNLDVTITDIIEKARNICPDSVPELALEIAFKIEKLIDGKVFHDEKDNTFWIHKNNGDKFSFSSEAEGFRKFGLLWQLVMNKSISERGILLWDEPEANLNPKLIPALVDIIIALEQSGIQMFLATHDYFFAKFLEVRKNKNTNILYHALYKKEDFVLCESGKEFELLENNSIIAQSIALYKEEIEKVMG
jgi:predicted ATPase